ncbi:hypothetical protein NDU88_003498 [Pleurodeles waltl]|uniref:Uncharacterized protein n=1 Tax=Pleurodeles waltl TaxID=8319 RepID=A0AAV7W4Y3_PLEWA|nr:hypothetical protein NDU88_003498 [Pleurodeles waltl]
MAPRGPEPLGPTVVRAGPRVVRLLLLARQLAPSRLRGHAVGTVLIPPQGPQPCACLPAQAPFRAALASEASSVFYFLGALPLEVLPGPLRFLRALGRPAPLTALHRVQSRGPASHRQGDPPGASPWAPVVSPGPITALWGLAPLGPPGHRRTSPLPGGPGAAQRYSRLLPEATPGPRCRSFRETLLWPPSSLRPSAHARRQPTATHFGARAGARPLPGPAPSSSPSLGHRIARRWHAFPTDLYRPLGSEGIKRAPSPDRWPHPQPEATSQKM